MYWRYSSSVVAPMQRSWPRASAGLSRFEASIAPSPAPAPTTVWISSMKSTISPIESVTSVSTDLRRSSNSPRYLAPAISAPMSSDSSRRLRRLSGTSPDAMRCARPSAIAVLPTPGSPMRMGLFLVRRERTVIARRTSSSRPMTGSSLPSRAKAVRSLAYFSSASYVPSCVRDVMRLLPRTWSMAERRVGVERSDCCASTARPHRSSFSSARTTCSPERKSSVSSCLCASAFASSVPSDEPTTRLAWLSELP
mmetsp:Transcript_10992/g.28145  ORF Transcript_10992/g.28145 Transcript_10992/m.28145 type:complete len:253 (+) Transcript_10992:673-1431(+)